MRSDYADAPVFFREALLVKCYSWLVLPAPGCSASSSLTDLRGWLLIFMKVLRKLPPLHSTPRHVPLILEHSERGPVWSHWKSFIILPASAEMIKESPWWQETRFFFFFQILSEAPSRSTLSGFFFAHHSDLLIKSLTVQENGPDSSSQFIVAAFCLIRQNVLMEQNDFTSLALIVWAGFLFLYFSTKISAVSAWNIKVRTRANSPGLFRKIHQKKERKMAFPVQGAADDPGALSLLIMCLEIPGR